MKMGTQFPEGTTNMWQSTLYEGHIAIDVHARYFTACKTAPKEANLSFSQGVNPDGVLSRLRKHDLIHGPDNKVAYLKTGENGRYVQEPY